MDLRVIAVVVTYNRLQFLPAVITALRNQDYPVSQIIVINNGSTDGTKQWLDVQSDLTIIHQENVGGSGGFHTGVKTAYEAGANWIWMMDDDIVPESNCLTALMQYSEISECINPIHIGTDNELLEEERWFDPASCTIVSNFNFSYQFGKKVWFRNIGSFEGLLVSRNLVEKIGFPDKRFFLTHDDLMYCYMAHLHTNVAVVADAVMRKQPVNKNPNSIYAYLYYFHRNLWLVEEYAAYVLKGFDGYRRRRIKLQFLYAAYKVFRFNDYPSRRKALATLYKAYRHYKRKLEGKTWA